MLCLPHHAQATGKYPRMSKDTVRRHAANPINIQNRVTPASQLFTPEGGSYSVKIEDVVFEYVTTEGFEYPIIVVDGINAISFTREGEGILLNCVFYDKDGKLIAKVEDGEFQSSIDIWDWNLVGQKLLIKSKSHNIDVHIELNPELFTIKRARLFGPLGTKVEMQSKPSAGRQNIPAGYSPRLKNSCVSFSPFGVSIDHVNRDGFVQSEHSLAIAEEVLELARRSVDSDVLWYLGLVMNKVITTAALSNAVEVFHFLIVVKSFQIKHRYLISVEEHPKLFFTTGKTVIDFHRLCGNRTTKGAEKYLRKALSFDEAIYGGGYRAAAKYYMSIALLEKFYVTGGDHYREEARQLANDVIRHYASMLKTRSYPQDETAWRAAIYLSSICLQPKKSWLEASRAIAFDIRG